MNTIWSLKPGLTVLRVFGFWPFRINEKNQIQPSRAYNLYSWMLLITFAVLLGYSFVFENLENDLESTVSFLLLVLVNFVVFLAILETVWKQSDQREMLENFQHVDNILQFRMSNSIFDHLRGHFSNSVALEMVLLSVIMAVSIAIHLILKVPEELKHFAFYFVGYTFSSMRYLQIIYFTWMIRSRLNYLKEALLKLVYKKNITVKTVSISAMDTIRIRDFDFGVKKNRVVPFEKGLATFNGDLSGLAVLRDVYNKLWINSQLFNKAFGLSLLVNIGYDFLALTTDIYWLIVSFSTTVPSVSPTPALYVATVTAVLHFINVVLICGICHYTTISAQDVALLNNKFDFESISPTENYWVQQFSLQLIHQKMIFSANGFFDIDFTLIFTIVGACTTYLIILVQFRMSEFTKVLPTNSATPIALT